jgi:DNA polymerase III alpha subunit (gram-positive type)
MSDTQVKPTIYVGIDIETTGLDLLRNSIVQLGAYATGENENDFYGYFVEDANPFVNDEGVTRPNNEGFMSFQQTAFDVNGFTLDRVNNAEPLVNVLCRFAVWMDSLMKQGEIMTVFHGAKFDVPRIELATEWFNVPDPKAFRRVIDTQSLGFLMHGVVESLKNLAARYGITDHRAHDALADAMTTMKVFHAIKRAQAKKAVNTPPWESSPGSWVPYTPLTPHPYTYTVDKQMIDLYGSDIARSFNTHGIPLDAPRC